MAFRDMWNDLMSSVPRLPPPLAQTLINRAWHEICDYRLWSWKVQTGYIVTPQIITTGACSVTNGSDLAIMDAAATAALNAITGQPPPASTQLGIGRHLPIS